MPKSKLVVLISGSGSNLRALIDATEPRPADAAPRGARADEAAAAQPGEQQYPAEIVAVISDRDASGLEFGVAAGIPTHVVRFKDYSDRGAWDRAMADQLAEYEPDLIVSAGFMRVLGDSVLTLFGGKIINTHPALLPAFPGAHGVRDALAYGVKITGATVHLVDSGVDTGPVLDQRAVAVRPQETEPELHERIKIAERKMLIEVVGRICTEGIEPLLTGDRSEPTD